MSAGRRGSVRQVKNNISNSGVHSYKAGIWGYLFGCALIESVLSARNPFFIRTALTTSKVGSHCETPGEVKSRPMLEKKENAQKLTNKHLEEREAWGLFQNLCVVHPHRNLAVRKLEVFSRPWNVSLIAVEIVCGFLETRSRVILFMKTGNSHGAYGE